MNLYLDLDDILPEFQQLDPHKLSFSNLTEDAQKVVSKFGTAYLTMAPYIGPYVEISAPKSLNFEDEPIQAGLFKIAKLTVQPGEIVVVKCDNTIDLARQIELEQVVQRFFPENKTLVLSGIDIGVAGWISKPSEEP